jgi:hypothetical protein
MGNFQKRLREYERPQNSVSGFSSSKKDLAYWAKRASDNSETATPASGKMNLHSTGGAPSLRSTSSPPKDFNADPYKAAKADLNSVGSSYMRGVRRSTR